MGGYPHNQAGGPYGQNPFGQGPRTSLNLKLPLTIAACVFALVFLMVAGIFALNFGRRAWREVEAAQARAKIEAQIAQAEIERQARWSQMQAESQARAAQLRQEQEARNAQFAADQQARIDRMRSFSSGIPAPSYPPPAYTPPPIYTPPPFTPPVSTYVPPPSFSPPPAFNPVAPPTTTRVEAPPPGFPATDMSQLRAKDLVYVLSNKTWYPAVVLLKRGVLTRIRYSTNGNIEIVSLDRIRLEKDPNAKSVNGVPAALRPVEEDGDEAAFTAKPDNTGEGGAPMNAVTSETPVAADSKLRTWTDSTGQFKIDAELIGFVFDQVQLRRADGKVVNMPIDKLSADDQAIVREKYPQ
ncbi:SHD1 domain-containing protein [Anatilimnocola sp. NA78]|uniref:SHD1 domain-containing protein n=1 Tax=Anatilimnocola sp. NA78 TaxID=3415683 RepID=UPI003CE5C1A4